MLSFEQQFLSSANMTPDTEMISTVDAMLSFEQQIVEFISNSGVYDTHTNKNSFVLNSLILSLSFAAFSNSNRFAVSRISTSSFAI
jgi:hypothetical protein